MAKSRKGPPRGYAEGTPLEKPFYIHLEKDNASHAKDFGRKIFGSASAYINALIANDRGVEPKLGSWKSPGESKAVRQGNTDVPPPETEMPPHAEYFDFV